MSGLLWEDVWEWFDLDLNGTLPDVHVPGTTAEDWRSLLELVKSERWQWTYLIGAEPAEPPAAVEDMLLRQRDDESVSLKVWPVPGVLAIFRPHDPERIDFDVDLRELQGQQQLDLLCQFFTLIGRKLRKPVLMTPEGSGNDPVLGYDVAADRVIVLAGE